MEFFDSVIFSDGDNAMVGDDRSDSSDLEIPIEGLSIGDDYDSVAPTFPINSISMNSGRSANSPSGSVLAPHVPTIPPQHDLCPLALVPLTPVDPIPPSSSMQSSHQISLHQQLAPVASGLVPPPPVVDDVQESDLSECEEYNEVAPTVQAIPQLAQGEKGTKGKGRGKASKKILESSESTTVAPRRTARHLVSGGKTSAT